MKMILEQIKDVCDLASSFILFFLFLSQYLLFGTAVSLDLSSSRGSLSEGNSYDVFNGASDSLNISFDFLREMDISFNESIAFDPKSLFNRNDVIPGRGIAYIKVYKTGSTTVTTTLHRIAASHNLNCPLMPKSIPVHFSEKKSQNFVSKKLEGLYHRKFPFDMYVNHCFFSREFLFRAGLAAKHRYVATVRDPATRVASGWTFKEDAIESAKRKAHALNCTSWYTCALLAKEKPELARDFITKWKSDKSTIPWEYQS